jgi:hypothetical protein
MKKIVNCEVPKDVVSVKELEYLLTDFFIPNIGLEVKTDSEVPTTKYRLSAVMVKKQNGDIINHIAWTRQDKHGRSHYNNHGTVRQAVMYTLCDDNCSVYFFDSEKELLEWYLN